jgi:hypothetical protein
MNLFVAKFTNVVKGILSGFDRIVFKGTILPLMRSKGAMDFCRSHGILNKDFKTWVTGQTGQIVGDAQRYAQMHCDQEKIPMFSSKVRKEDVAHGRQQELQVVSGLIGVWSAMESCTSYRAKFSENKNYPRLEREWMKCKHLYFYFDHAHYGFMSVRLQTWFPYSVQIALNGREWLRRSLEAADIDFVVHGNKFVHVADFERAQTLLHAQLDTQWRAVLNGFVSEVFPAREAILGARLPYYWTLWQSEWATDFIFPSPREIAPLADSLLRHALLTGTGPRILRYLDRPLKKDGSPRPDLPYEVLSRMQEFHEGLCVRHWVGANSVKCYNELNTFRVETTANDPSMFRVHRHAQGQASSEPKRLLPLRQGVADIVLRAEVSQEVNNRFMENLAATQCETPVRDLIQSVVHPFTKDGRRVRALDLTGKDRALLQAIAAPQFCVAGLSNKDLRQKLADKSGYDKRTQEQLAAKLTRQIRLLRDHGLLRKLPRQNRYVVTKKARELTAALDALLSASTKQLINIAA